MKEKDINNNINNMIEVKLNNTIIKEDKANEITAFIKNNMDMSCGDISKKFEEPWQVIWTIMQSVVRENK